MKINEVENFDELSDFDLYLILAENKEVFQTLHEENVLEGHELWDIVRNRTITSLYFLNLFLWDANPFGGPDSPISENHMNPENHQHVIDMFVKKDPTKTLANLSAIKTNLILYPRGSMKALDLDTLIPTPNGFKKMGEMEIGDKVFASDGSITKVTCVSPIYYDRPCYEVEFSTGEKIVADEGHLWITDARRDRDNKSRRDRSKPAPSVKTTKQIKDTLLIRKERNHRVKVSPSLSLPEKNLLIPPYVLGVWLGDGTSSAAQITNDPDDVQIVREVQKFGQSITKQKGKFAWGLTEHEGQNRVRNWIGRFVENKNSFLSKLKQINVLNNKHIPTDYLRSSKDQRLLLLQGLMDTDGSISEEGACVFNSTNKTLADDVAELISSLGFRVSRSSTSAKYNGKITGTSYFITFYPYKRESVFRLDRKKNRQKDSKKVSLQNYRQIVAVNEVPSRPVRCISVEDDEHLYLVGRSFIPTHNSSWGIVDIIQWVLYDYKIRILVLSAADDLAAAIVDEARGYFGINEVQPTFMNMFWPEHCLSSKDFGPTGSFTTPKWLTQQIERRESTIMSRGVTSSAQGFHFEVIEGDDIVETRNSSETQCIEIIKKFYITRKTLRNFGYCNLRGTRYHEQDLYGEIISKAQLGEFHEEEFSITERKLVNPSRKTQILIGAAMTIKPDAELEMVKYNLPRLSWFRKAGPEGVILLMPKVPTLTYDALLVEYEDNAEAFETQQRQNVLPPTQQMFTREMILKNVVPWLEVPPYGRITHCWDLNGGKGKKENDFCVGTAVLWDSKGTGYVIDIACENYPNPVAIAQAIVFFACNHHPDVISIEDSQGIRMLQPTIIAEADKTDDRYVKELVRRLYWRSVDTKKDAKKNRIQSLFPLIQYGRIKFQFGLKEMERFIGQIIRPVTKGSKNDIPDCLSYQVDFLPYIPQNEEERRRIDEEMKRRRLTDVTKSTYEMLYTEQQGTYLMPQIYETPVEEIQNNPKPYMENDGIENILGFGLIG